MLRPVPEYAMNPFYWLGALAVVAFVIQGVTGMIMMLYYVPSPAQAYSSTVYIFQNVSNGRFLESVHLYTAYAMIMLSFMHMMRGYFVSVHKEPREVMWIVGMLMGMVTLGFGFTGYLLPWSVISYSATNAGIGMITALPPPLSTTLHFLIVGGNGDADTLLRFFDLHVVILPAVLLVLLAVKMYMLEAHGVAEPPSGLKSGTPQRLFPIFPDVTVYLLELSLLFGVGMLLISAVFPLSLPPEYSTLTASQYTVQPDWYFLWIYQILKLSFFEDVKVNGVNVGLPLALSLVTLVFATLVLLPFLDRSKVRSPMRRPVYVTLGAIFVGEVLTLSYWGYISPGQTIPAEQAALVIGGIALLVSLGSLVAYRLLYSRAKAHLLTAPPSAIQGRELKNGVAFTLLVAAGAVAIGWVATQVPAVLYGAHSASDLLSLTLSLGALALVSLASVALTYRLDYKTGSIKRRVRALERGLSE